MVTDPNERAEPAPGEADEEPETTGGESTSDPIDDDLDAGSERSTGAPIDD